MTNPPKVSVVIPTYNRAKHICEAVNTVLLQDFKDYEIIVVDDGSTDDTQDVLAASFGNKIRYFRQQNKGPAATRNVGVSISNGEYVAFLDSDDLWLPGKLSIQVKALDQSPDSAFVCTEAYYTDNMENVIAHWKKKPHNKETFESLREENFVTTSSVMVRKKHFLDVGGFDEKLTNVQDYDLWLRLSMKFKFKFIEALYCKVRKHTTNITKNTDARVRSYQRILGKKDLWRSMPFFKKQLKVAKIYHSFARAYAQSGFYGKAALFYLKSVLTYPVIGSYYGSAIQTYLLIIIYGMKEFRGRQ